MTSENRQRLASAFELLLSYAGRLQDPSVSTQTGPAGSGFGIRVEVYGKSASHFAPHTDLTPFQAMCLAGLLGDPGQLEAAVVDYAIEAGVDVVTAAYERGKREERERCAEVCEAFSSDAVIAWADGGSYDNIESGHRIASAIRGGHDPEIHFDAETETVYVNGRQFTPPAGPPAHADG